MLELANRLMWSADVEDEAALQRHLGQMPDLTIVKLDRSFLTDRSLSIIWRVSESRKVFVDAKIIEIADKVEQIARKYLRYRPWMLNCMAGVVSTGLMAASKKDKLDGLKRFADACHEYGTLPCAVTVLTNKTPEITDAEFRRTPTDQVLRYLEWLLAAGFTDVVCSPLEVPAIRAESRFDKLNLNTPGIRRAGSDEQDQARVNTPSAALAAGADRLVVGRDLTIGNPAENLKAILAEMATAQIPTRG